MMRRLAKLLLLTLPGALMAPGCGGPARVTGAAPLVSSITRGDVLAAEFPGSARVLSGFTVAGGPGQWRPGDRVLIGLSFARGVSQTKRMLLVELLEEPGRRAMYQRRVGVFGEDVTIDSPTRATVLRIYDADGEPLSERPGQLAEVFLDYGPWQVARIGGGYAIASGGGDTPAENPRPEVTLEMLRPGVYGMMSLLAFGEGAGDNPALSGLIERAFTLGQKFGLLVSMGRFEIRIGTTEPLAASERVRTGLGALEMYDSEVLVSVNDRLALAGRAVLAPSLAPLGLCGGIVLAELVNAADPDIRASVVLLAAGRGESDTNSHGTGANPAE